MIPSSRFVIAIQFVFNSLRNQVDTKYRVSIAISMVHVTALSMCKSTKRRNIDTIKPYTVLAIQFVFNSLSYQIDTKYR